MTYGRTVVNVVDQLAEARRVSRGLEEASEGAEEVAEVDSHADRVRTFRTPAFARMQTRWTNDEAAVIDTAKSQAMYEVTRAFGDAFIILDRIWEIVRTPLVNRTTGEIVFDNLGAIQWQIDAEGMAIEDYSRLTDSDREKFVHQITTRLLHWELTKDQFWGEAMFAKASWEERFSETFVEAPFVEGKRPTEADRTNHAQNQAWERRYLALYKSMRSRMADSVVRSMERIAMRMKEQIV